MDDSETITVTCAGSAFKADKRKIKALTRFICDHLGLPRCELSVSLVSSATIQELNKNYRSKDRPTDVLSFPQQEWDEPLSVTSKRPAGKTPATKSIPKNAAKQRKHTAVQPIPHAGPPLVLGDLVISLTEAELNASAIGQPLDRELGFLLVHGILHLCGHDHEDKQDEKHMLKEQRKLMKLLTASNSPPLWHECVVRRAPLLKQGRVKPKASSQNTAPRVRRSKGEVP